MQQASWVIKKEGLCNLAQLLLLLSPLNRTLYGPFIAHLAKEANKKYVKYRAQIHDSESQEED